MSRQVKVKVRPGSTVLFPGICVRCSREAGERLSVSKRSGRLTRQIELPLCDDCFRELNRESGDEERLRKMRRVVSIAAPLLVLLLVFALLPSGLSLWLRLGVGLLMAFVAFQILGTIFKRAIRKAALPEKSAILESAAMVDFSWRATTFEFENEQFAERFSELNESQLMEL